MLVVRLPLVTGLEFKEELMLHQSVNWGMMFLSDQMPPFSMIGIHLAAIEKNGSP